MSRRLPRGICGACGKEYALRWSAIANVWSMRRHGVPREHICEGSGCDPERITLTWDDARRNLPSTVANRRRDDS